GGGDHVVQPLERVARDLRRVVHQREVVLEGSFPVEVLVQGLVLALPDVLDDVEDGRGHAAQLLQGLEPARSGSLRVTRASGPGSGALRTLQLTSGRVRKRSATWRSSRSIGSPFAGKR